MVKVRSLIFLFLVGYLCPQFSGCVSIDSEAVQTLVEIEKDMKVKDEALEKSDESYLKLKTAMEEHHIKAGTKSSRVKKRFGKPVAVLTDGEGERWFYRAKEGGRFKAHKIYLFFNKNRRLEKWECIRTDCPVIEPESKPRFFSPASLFRDAKSLVT